MSTVGKALFTVSRGATNTQVVGGINTPIPGLAITDSFGLDAEEGWTCSLTHVPSGHAIGHFLDAESAAGCALAVGGLTDWLALDALTDAELAALGDSVRPIVKAWNGSPGSGNTRGDHRHHIEERV